MHWHLGRAAAPIWDVLETLCLRSERGKPRMPAAGRVCPGAASTPPACAEAPKAVTDNEHAIKDLTIAYLLQLGIRGAL